MRFFDKCYIVTDSKDKETLELCKDINSEKISLICTDSFYSHDAPFAKANGYNDAFQYVNQNSWTVLWDADMIIGNSFSKTLPDIDTLDQSKMYAPKNKYHVQHDFEEAGNCHFGPSCAGFFQLFHFSQLIKIGGHPSTTGNCSGDDNLFSRCFPGIEWIDLPMFHLGPRSADGVENHNWEGRKSPPCPFTLGEVKEMISPHDPLNLGCTPTL